MKNSTPIKIRPKTTPALEALKTHKIFGDKVMAIQEARSLSRKNPTVRLYRSPTSKFIVSSEKLGFEEIDYVNFNINSYRDQQEEEFRCLYYRKIGHL